MNTNDLKAIETFWDYIIIGTGMGGSVLGLSLAKAGHSVLFCEKGLASEKLEIKGDYPEMKYKNVNAKTLQKAGRRSAPVLDLSFKKPRSYTPFMGEGAGGSSLLYGMAMERGHAEDFDSWPFSYNEIKSSYEEAESLFGVAPSKTLNPQNMETYEFLMSKGLHPYKLPLASQQENNCSGCQSYLCNHNSKNHAGNRALAEALKHKRTHLLDQCEVQSLKTDSIKITEVMIKKDQKIFGLKGNCVVLAAGALETPRLLFRSQTQQFPSGLANSSGQVGKNLMRHLMDLYVLDAKGIETSSATKQLAFNDFYTLPEGKGGTVQSFGDMPPIKMIMKDLLRDLSFHSPIAKKIGQILAPFISYFLKRKFNQSVVLASIVEDAPNESNQVLNNSDQTTIKYQIQEADKQRLNAMRKHLKSVLKPKLKMRILSGEKNTLLAHACGTCRMGNDPKTSVVNKNGRTHDLENLYIADASVFSSSMGVNPALTIAANALRMAKEMTKAIPRERIKIQPKIIELVS